MDDSKETKASALHLKRPLALASAALGIFLLLITIAIAIPYHRLARRVDRQLASPLLKTLDYYSASEIIAPGDSMSPSDFAVSLKRAGYSFTQNDQRVIVSAPEPIEVAFEKGRIISIVGATSSRSLPNFQLRPQLISNMSSDGRAKSMPVHFSEIPPVAVQAIISAEDKRFFKHSGLDTPRIVKAVYVDLRDRGKKQGASTITMQLARNLWLGHGKSWKRKVEEALITIHLERKLSKNQIFEEYCNLVYLGGDGVFGIDGIGEAAQAYFNKDVRRLNLTEAATLAGLIQRPVYFNPFRFPDRAIARRNVVLKRMRENNFVSDAEYREATAAPLGLQPGTSQLSESQYFIDIAAGQASKQLEPQASDVSRIYTTLDPRLQSAAEHAIADGMLFVDKQLASRHTRQVGSPQVALIVLDPHTGEVKAICGGRNYGTSQLNRVFAKRPPGSVFKPFVYTAALNTAITGADPVLTPASVVDDSPTTFEYGNQTYSPANFKQEFMGQVTLRRAMAHSLNVATVKVAQMVGFKNVVAVAQEAGMNADIQPTPAVALGAYQVTPLEIARAYTIFANSGNLVQPAFISEIRDSGDGVLYHQVPRTKQVLDPRVAFLMVDMLQEVIRSGTGAGVRSRGFRLPAAGKTGTSHDGWFAGFTSSLLCVVWVGFDDYSDLGLEGAKSALPIWTQFMTEAARYKQYGDAKPFQAPGGVTQTSIDSQTGELAGPDCPPGVWSYFIDGTQPQTQCTPQQIEIISTANGGVIERSVPAQVQVTN
jgi:penicillin-binding protein 1B